jgi:hypothetical protein
MCQNDLENMLSQGSEFYQRLVEHLTILKQNVSDFKNARSMQATDLCRQLGVPPPNSQPMPAFVPQGMPPVMPPNSGMNNQNQNYQFFQPPGGNQ